MTKVFFILATFFAFSGCTHSVLTAPEVTKEYANLAKTGRKDFTYSVAQFPDGAKLGHQYVFLVFPAGTVLHQDLRTAVLNTLFRAVARAGLRPLEVPSEKSQLHIKQASLSVTAYDLIFFRIVRATAEVEVYFGTKDSKPVLFRRSKSALRLFGFTPQLNFELEKLLDLVGDQIIQTATGGITRESRGNRDGR